ncbi:TRAP transporter large permease [Microbacterium album]|uniref:C4-dicarboxylate ABC transporter permease n=1 Tax=Microbacterium album TaxID=2053191 RepID=A0A917IGM7_9MICO|nr:TRAP transporter large permease [Microbacterium album]GGH44791.1 C4-dicarboxylate ABC transporter permease [Microbacterium album]
MQIWHVVLLTIVLMFVLLAIRVPVGFTLGISGALGLTLLHGTGYATNTLGSVPFANSATFTLTIIPMFILMGMLAVRANIAENVFAVANHFVRRAPGGLGVATVMACAGFSAVSGSSIGTAATMAKLSVAQMRAAGYPASLATGVVAIAGTLGVMIPPSTFLVLYAVMAGESVAQMLAAGILPGLLSAVGYIAYIMIAGQRQVRRTDPAELEDAIGDAQAELRTKRIVGRSAEAGAAGDRTPGGTAGAGGRGSGGTALADPVAPHAGRTRLRSLPWRGVVHIAILFIVVLGGMYSGFFTSTESAAVGALAALIILAIENRRGGLRGIVRHFREALLDTAQTTSMVFFVVIGSAILSTFFVAAGVTRAITEWVGSLPLSPMLVMAILLVCLVPLGMFLESMSILIITVPILYPIAEQFGFSGVWLGIMIVKLIEIGMVTPPVGILTFVVSGITGVKPEKVFRGVMPLLAIDVVTTTLLFLFPAISLFLPSLVQR